MYVSMSHMLCLPVVFFLDVDKYPVNYALSLFLLTIPFLVFGFDILKSGITKLFHNSPNMDTLVSIGVIANFTYSVINMFLVILGNSLQTSHLYFEGCAMILYFVSIGRYIDKMSKNKTKDAIKELVQITPYSAILKINGKDKEVTIDEIKKR